VLLGDERLTKARVLPKYIEIDGKRIAWRDLLKLWREQRKAAQKTQLTLFEMRNACELGRTVNCVRPSHARLHPAHEAST
jgi:hypothetical protein